MALIHIGGKSYELVHENRNGWNPESFRSRYSEVLERYDFIIGDWGYNQLRLKGFFRDNHQKANRDCSFSSISDYINEYCNFGCAYFILEKKQGAAKEFGDDDLDLNEAPAIIALDGMDLRAAAESAATAEADVVGLAASREAAVIPQRNRHRYQPRTEAATEQQEQQQGHGRQEKEGRGARESRNSQGDSRRRDKEHQHHKGNNRNHEHKGKKPSRNAPNRVGSHEPAASEPRQSRGASHKGNAE